MDRISMITALFSRALVLKSIGGDSLKYIGVTTTALTDGATTNPITIDGDTVTATNGDVALYGGDAFVFNGTIWQSSSAISQIFTEIGDLSDLDTEAKTDLVSAINEVNEEKQDDVELSLTPTAVVSDRDIQDGQGNTLSVLAEALTKTASGNPVVISDCAGGKARSLKTVINALQDLHGFEKPWAGGAYKNKLPMVLSDIKTTNTDGTWSGNVYTINGVAVTVLTDSADNVIGFNLNGVCTANFNFYVTALEIGLEANGMTYSGLTTGSDTTYFLYWDGAGVQVDTGEVTITTGRNPIRMGRIVVRANANLSNLKVYPMVRPSTESDPTFAPYSNICPISGRDSVVVDDVGKNQLDVSAVTQGSFDNPSATANCVSDYTPVSGGTNYYISGNSGYADGIYLRFYDANKTELDTSTRISKYVVAFGFTAPSAAVYTRIMWYKGSGLTPTNVANALVQLEIGTTATAYEPYAHSSATIQLGQTVYGADINWDTGVMTVTHVLLVNNTADMDNSEDWPGWRTSGIRQYIGGGINRVFTGQTMNVGTVYGANTTGNDDTLILPKDTYNLSQTEWKALSMDVQILIPLATPTTIQLTPEQLEMLKGYNRVTIDNGSIELGYIAKAISGNDEEIAPLVGDKATKAYAVNDFIERADGLYRVTAPIASGASFTANNTVKMSIGEALTYLYNK